MRLLVISHTPHYEYQGVISGWGSTIRELDHLAGLFDELVHLAPLYTGRPPESSLPYSSKKIKFIPVKPAGGDGFKDKLSIFGAVPVWLKAMRHEINSADAIHIRCPAGISLIALFAQKLWGRGKPSWVKYAGNWKPSNKEFWSYRMQRFWLGHNFHRGIVTVNGTWLHQPAHIITFNNPSFSQIEWFHAKQEAAEKDLSFPLKFVFVGRADEAKGVGRILEIAAQLLGKGIAFHLDVIGDGPNREIFEQAAVERGLSDQVSFLGWKNRLEINKYYKDAHFILLPSTSEGWPKVLSEAMAYGVVPLASDISSIPSILSNAKSGLAIPSNDINSFVRTIISYVEDPLKWKRESQNGVIAAESFTYEYYLNAVCKFFNNAWKIELGK